MFRSSVLATFFMTGWKFLPGLFREGDQVHGKSLSFLAVPQITGPTGICTPNAGFKVQGADHGTMGPLR